jgi:hypothetical protein
MFYIFRELRSGDRPRRSASTSVRPRTSTSSAPADDAIASGSTSVFRSQRTFTIFRSFSWRRISSIITPLIPRLPIHTVGLRCCIDPLSMVRPHRRKSGLVPADETGDDDPPPIYPDTCVRSGNEIGIAPAAESTLQSPVDPDTLAHPDLSRQLYTAVAPFRVLGIKFRRTHKKCLDPFPGKPLRTAFTHVSRHDGAPLYARMYL